MYLVLENIEFSPERASQGFSVGGELYVSVEDMFFPAEHWYDMVFFNMKNWLPRLISFGKNHTDICVLSYMDGPYSISLNRIENGNVSVVFRNDRAIAKSLDVLDFPGFLKSVKACCHQYDRFLYANGKENLFTAEINELKTILDT